jgi:hypothetical protein
VIHTTTSSIKKATLLLLLLPMHLLLPGVPTCIRHSAIDSVWLVARGTHPRPKPTCGILVCPCTSPVAAAATLRSTRSCVQGVRVVLLLQQLQVSFCLQPRIPPRLGRSPFCVLLLLLLPPLLLLHAQQLLLLLLLVLQLAVLCLQLGQLAKALLQCSHCGSRAWHTAVLLLLLLVCLQEQALACAAVAHAARCCRHSTLLLLVVLLLVC